MSRAAPIYNADEREGLRAAGRFNARLMDHVRPFVKAGIRTAELDRIVQDFTLDHGHTPACLGYNGYPACSCISVNEVVCHGIPGEQVLQDGDIVNVDLTTIVDGWYGDQSETFLIGAVPDEARRLVQVTFDSLWVGIHAARPFGKVRDIGAAIYSYARQKEFEVVREYQGHGIGRSFHQDPGVPHFWFRGSKAGQDILRPGTCFTIEPMLNAGTWKTVVDKADRWTVRTLDGKLSAQFEHTILMTDDGPEILTQTAAGPAENHVFAAPAP